MCVCMCSGVTNKPTNADKKKNIPSTPITQHNTTKRQAQAVVEELSGILHCILNARGFHGGAARDSVLLLLGALQVCGLIGFMCVCWPVCLDAMTSLPSHVHN